MIVLLSIKPQFAEAILDGTKKFEYRRRLFPAAPGRRVLIYASAPRQMLIGEFVVGRVITGSPQKIWKETRNEGGVEREFFFTYFEDRATAHALEVLRPRRYRRARNPWELIEHFTPPQFFRYVDPLDFAVRA